MRHTQTNFNYNGSNEYHHYKGRRRLLTFTKSLEYYSVEVTEVLVDRYTNFGKCNSVLCENMDYYLRVFH
jgi:hypothetical protein